MYRRTPVHFLRNYKVADIQCIQYFSGSFSGRNEMGIQFFPALSKLVIKTNSGLKNGLLTMNIDDGRRESCATTFP